MHFVPLVFQRGYHCEIQHIVKFNSASEKFATCGSVSCVADLFILLSFVEFQCSVTSKSQCQGGRAIQEMQAEGPVTDGVGGVSCALFQVA